MLDRRTFLLSGAALAGCATSAVRAEDNFQAQLETLDGLAPPERLRALREVDPRTLTPTGRILFDAIGPGVEADAALASLPYGADGGPYAVTHRNGNYRRADADADAIAEDSARLQADAALGVIAPDFVLDAAIPLVESAASNAAGARAEALGAQTRLLRSLRSRATGEASVRRLPQGEAFYRATLQRHLGAMVDAHEAQTRARARCEMLHAQADLLLRSAGLTHGSVGARLGSIVRNPSQHYPASEAGRAAALADMRATLAAARALAAPIFSDPLPSAEIVALPVAEQAGGARGRREDNAYIVDLGGMRPRWSLPSVVYHETLPGHLLQAPFERGSSPLQRRYAGGYSEGWAIYAERLADEHGGFAGEPLARLGYLHWMLFRLGRIVADTGMHALGWSRAHTIAELRAIQGENIAFVSIEDDVDRMAAQPGVAAAQGLAALAIEDIRAEARKRAGRRFTLAAFHSAMLRHGPLSPPGLARAALIALP
jgi:uncharacterized protein (DUF885 family)